MAVNMHAESSIRSGPVAGDGPVGFGIVPSAHPSRQLAHPLFHRREDRAAAHELPHGGDVRRQERSVSRWGMAPRMAW